MDLRSTGAVLVDGLTVEVTVEEGDSRLVASDGKWRLGVDTGGTLSPDSLVHVPSGRVVADRPYCYRFTVGATDGSGYSGPDRPLRAVLPIDADVESLPDGPRLTLRGRADFGPDGPTDIRVEHAFQFLTDGAIAERIALVHHHGRDRHSVSDIRFGLRKALFDRSEHRWADGADRGSLVPVPFRRRAGQAIDHRLASYTAADLMPEEWAGRGLPARAAEGWLWGDDAGGFLVSKYRQDDIEFALADGEFVTTGQPGALHVTHLNSNNDLCLRFAGAGVFRDCPESAAELGPGAALVFGASTIEVYQGGWQDGFGRYKARMRGHGHVVPEVYRPRVHWNELYHLGWRCGGNAPLQELDQLWQEAELAKAAGAQAFYFDPGWDLFEGSSVWDTERLGPLRDFVARLRDEYGLTLALHLMMHTKSLDEDPAIYRRLPDGGIDVWKDQTPYSGGYICAASPAWQRQKTDRLLALAAEGVSFFMFDFVNYGPAVIDVHAPAYRSRPTCWSPDHGHAVPLTRKEHADGIMAVITAVKRAYPDVTIEAHDRIGGEFLPLYYQHNGVDSHDEIWGFEYMWDPYADLLSGKALSLCEYNLAYDIPLYLHINCAHDSPTMLAFWWYASCCRHLGIGGVAPGSQGWDRLREAMSRYGRLREHFTRGEFVGFDYLVHGHLRRDTGSMVVAAFNIGGGPCWREVVLDVAALGLGQHPSVSGADAIEADGTLRLRFEVPALSPHLIEINC